MEHAIAREKAARLVAEMTLEEKASQLRYDAPAIPRLGIPAYNWWNEGLHGVARAGTATVFPQAIGLAAMFDGQILYEIAQVIAHEGRAKYNAASAHGDRDIYKGLTFWSPNINIFRDPRWGRGHETYGEDPCLTAELGVKFVKGLQGDGEYLKAAACAKHYAVHSGPEAVRHSFDAQATPKDMWETYLPAFEALVKDGDVEAVMGAYNRTNGEPCCGSKTLLKDILLEKWGFQGHVVSDCWAIRDFHENHHVTDTAPQSAAMALENGCNVNCGITYIHLMAAYQEGLVTEEQITDACIRLLATRFRLGLLGDVKTPYDAITLLENDTDEHDALALKAAEKSMTLLKNDGILPLNPEKVKTLAVIGPNADSKLCLEGNYNGTSSRYVTFLAGLQQACREAGVRLLFAPGSMLFKDKSEVLSQRQDDRLSEAVAIAEMADAVIACMGLDATMEGEEGDTGNQYFSGDKNDLELPDAQKRLLSAVAKTGTPLVTVVAAGSALRVEEGNAILWAWYPGQAGGTALANLVFGKVSPSGRLPLTFYHGIDELPDFEDYSMKNRTYRYFEGKPLYPFGFGLSYTEFIYSDACFRDGAVTVTLKNTGKMDADEVIQVYVKCDSAHAPLHPVLCGFKRVHVKAGEEMKAEIALTKNAFTVVDDQGNRLPCEKGVLYVGGSQPDALSRQLTGKECLKIQL
ncbi:MAG: glycoside hydrolase family 3 C-terminal domain-containing protein [Clostridia bacterium]|nr:glycoside hydrolase family 3 C-terminal domain-containing protein [Clostridia bacterium]